MFPSLTAGFSKRIKLRLKSERALNVISVATKANKLLGLLKRTCPLLTDVSVGRTLYLSLVKSQLCFGTQVWSPSQHYLKGKIELVRRRATRWILRTRVGELSYREAREAQPPTSGADRGLKDLVLFLQVLTWIYWFKYTWFCLFCYTWPYKAK